MGCHAPGNESGSPPWWPVLAARAVSCMLGLLLSFGVPAATFNVTSAADVPDVTPGDGKCETVVDSQVVCTLRAAVQEANVLAGTDVINLQANTTYLLTRVGIEFASLSGSIDILDSVQIVGAGPDSTIIDGNGDVTGDRVFFVAACIGGDQFCTQGNVSATLSGISIRHGKTTGDGGGIDAPIVDFAPFLTLTNCRVEDNTSGGHGGGINSGSLSLTDTVVRRNSAVHGGGASASSNEITDSTFSDNTASGNGGALLGGPGRISGSTFNGNHAASGGALYTTSGVPNVPRVRNSTFALNRSDAGGGGIRIASGGANLYNVTIAGNSANVDRTGSDGAGSGLLVSAGATVNVSNSIIANNYSYTDSLFLIQNDCAGTFHSNGFNIVTHASCTITGTFSNASVSFGLLQDNGGPTQTLALLPGNAAIDGGDPTGCADDQGPLTVDQRGLPRPAGAACDLGAYEVQDLIFEDGFDAP